MNFLINLVIFVAAFAGMEFVAWSTHKYVMHGFLWRLHESHHRKREGAFELNDLFWVAQGDFRVGAASYPRSGTQYAFLSDPFWDPGDDLQGEIFQTVVDIPANATDLDSIINDYLVIATGQGAGGSQFAPGARPVFEGIDFSGNVAQGCAQFISHQVLMSNNRWNHCAQIVPEPTAFTIWACALACGACVRRRRRGCKERLLR